MNIAKPQSLTIEKGPKAVLLLHGFTGSTKDVKKLAFHLAERGYTIHAPIYSGHGVEPEALLETTPEDWWQDVVKGYQFLQQKGYKEIAVAGISLGGVFSLKVAETFPVKAVVSMCAPISRDNSQGLFTRLYHYARLYKSFEKKSKDQIISELHELRITPKDSLDSVTEITIETREQLANIKAPTLIMQGALDDELYQESAPMILNTVKAEEKEIIWYENSGHIITLGKERDQVNEDVADFLDQIEWKIAN
ncbi:MAG TPA: alpha/beta fold hydrolase [Metalysinibacillus jejuensis]|uniref:Alpha/beta fold hydrolase n=1 Tax=Metalysinibacillus jejuensis TaxID=914327 RepID=A0A921T4M8_9BACL|nr:alpha/beta fold hydrolase [Metalysinibacillus jejuensis]HJH10727.1 alpha/beta fold hydrolase [Metalysinibacillus jejuensis]